MKIIPYVLIVSVICLCSHCNTETNLNLQSVKNGQVLYNQYCANCHQSDGSGLARLIPPLAASDHLSLIRTHIPCIIRKGLKGAVSVNGITYNQPMPANPQLSEKEITFITNYVEWYFMKHQQVLSADSVNVLLHHCQ